MVSRRMWDSAWPGLGNVTSVAGIGVSFASEKVDGDACWTQVCSYYHP